MNHIFIFNQQSHVWAAPTINDEQLRSLGLFTAEDEFYLKVQGKDERVTKEKPVDLTRLGIEEIYSKKREKYRYALNDVLYISSKPEISEPELRKIGKIPPDEQLYLKIEGPNRVLKVGEIIDIAPFGIEEFYSETTKAIIVIVNGREKSVGGKSLSYDEVVRLAFETPVENGQTVYTVIYTKGPDQNPEGSMVKGDIVNIKNKMIFNVTATTKS